MIRVFQTVADLDGGRGSVASALGSALFFGLFGYATELVFAAPIYLALPRRAQGAGVIVPLAGVLAAIPWLLISVSYGGAVFARVAAPIAFGLGCLGGVAFALIRGRAGAPPGKRSREAPAKAPEGAAGDALAKSVAAPYPSARPALCTQPGQRETAWSRSGPPGSPTTAG